MTDIPALLRSIEIRSPAALVIRHAERPPILAHDGYRMTGLTENGKEEARNLGMSISDYFGSCRLFYSPVVRCQQTAEMLHEGILKSGNASKVHGPEEVLAVSYMLVDMNTGFDISDKLGNDFIRAWFDGEIEPGNFMPLPETLGQHLGYIGKKLDSSPGLDIHVTHDWNINVLREGIFRLRHEDSGWPGFLSGLAFTKNGSTLTAYYHDARQGKALTASIPL